MRTIKRTYFKALHDEPAYMSGCPMPDPTEGPYRFEKCDFHPRLWEALEQIYMDCEFVGCNWPRGYMI